MKCFRSKCFQNRFLNFGDKWGISRAQEFRVISLRFWDEWLFPGIGQPKTTNTFIRFLGPLMLNKYSFLAEVKKLIDRSKSFCLLFFFKKLGHPGLFSIYFLYFQINITILRTNVCDKCPSSIWWWDSNATSFRIWVSFHNH